jgi:hypothetical protein
MKSVHFPTLILVLILLSCKPKKSCQSLHEGNFKGISDKYGTTIITRTKQLQIEENNDLGYKLVFAVNWIDDCSYELRLKEILKGDSAFKRGFNNVIKIRVMEIKENSYISENTCSSCDTTTSHEIRIVK